MRNRWNVPFSLAGLIFAIFLSSSVALAQKPEDTSIAILVVTSDEVIWQPQIDNAGITLIISGPNSFYQSTDFSGDQAPSFQLADANGLSRADGAYQYELVLHPVLDPQIRSLMDSVTEETRYGVEAQLRAAGKLPEAQVQTGLFLLTDGSVILSGTDDLANDSDETGPSTRDQQILDDLIVDGSICVGQDCVNGESFGFDTIRLKENNLRIRFQDTSTSASFPSRDWQITINDSSNGGANKFSIDDIDGGRTPFTIEAGASSHSLYVDDGGRIGLGTSTPVVETHIVDGDTPTVRLEQDGSSGFTPQTWDMASNETNFFIRDASNGSTLPFRIRPGAPTSSLDIAADGDIGIGTTSPAADLHIRSTDGATDSEPHLLVQELSGTSANRTLLELENNGKVLILYENTEANKLDWQEQWSNGAYKLNYGDASTGSFNTMVTFSSNGNLFIEGTLSENSDIQAKENFVAIDGHEVLDRISEIPITSWNYKDDGVDIRHIGPMAQDFYAAFGLGYDERHIATLDTSGVSLAAIQALNQMVSDKDDQIAELQAQNTELETRLETLEKLVETLVDDNQ